LSYSPLFRSLSYITFFFFPFIPKRKDIYRHCKQRWKRISCSSETSNESGFVFIFCGTSHTSFLKGSEDRYVPPCFFNKNSTGTGRGHPAFSARRKKRLQFAGFK